MADTGTMDRQDRAVAETESPTTARRLRDQTATLGEDVRELGRITRDASHEKLEQAKQATTDYFDKGRKKATELEDSVVSYVREKPVKSMLIVAGAGALLGFLLSRR